jgi:GDPmannose 4,6-dehydratase
MAMKKVLITGILGQDGANMAEYLLSLNDIYVYGMMRRSGSPNYYNIKDFKDHERFRLVDGDLSDEISINNVFLETMPDYFINFGANSFVGCSWDMPLQVFDVNTLGVIRCLEAIKKHKRSCRFYSAGSSEEFGDVDYSPQDIKHPIKPRSPYGASKAATRHLVKVYRESYDLFAIHSILFNHEGIKRGEEFVTRKITKGVARISSAINQGNDFDPILLGNIHAKRDWSDSEDFVQGVWLMLNQDEPKEYILSSNETHSIKEFVELSFKAAGIQGEWQGKDLNEKYISTENKTILMEINKDFYRPAEVELLYGDSTPARTELGWNPKYSFNDLVNRMTENDIRLIK